jgi:hypothetical protein
MRISVALAQQVANRSRYDRSQAASLCRGARQSMLCLFQCSCCMREMDRTSRAAVFCQFTFNNFQNGLGGRMRCH